MSIKKSASAATLALLAAFCGSSAWADGSEQSGKVSLTLTHVRALLSTGSQDPAHDKDCTAQLKQPSSRYVGMRVSTSYSIDPKTLIESATSMFLSPVSPRPVELSVKMWALGLAGVYAFGAFHPAALPDRVVRFQIGLDFKNAVSTFLVVNPPSVGYNCWISSATTAPVASDFANPESK
ncbi:hypothetical protein ELE36_03185 [Pseudolysobacter antarcticus]|uniref:Uncharacterized protein n=1 Tax=Pseudolysobacter antarcticus TaxID=2511995 RepID=A0A411HG35_9GAMM|nr:hypothetical protein [Pseudolysobacter antarcticus]QBB69458.1 hypothetical protein ELE36_03185 [Pseudolysobacter antarcticus]